MRGVNVEIMGQSLVVASDDGGEDWARAWRRQSMTRSRRYRASSRTVNSMNVAILAALNFADELECLRRDHQALLSHLKALNQRLSEAIDVSR